MTRPRSQQVESVKTRYSRFSFVPSPGVGSTVISDATVFPNTVTGVQGGAEVDIAAKVTTALGPFAILAGDSFSVSLDGGVAVPVVLASTDTTSSRIAAKVIAALGPVAESKSGYMSIFSLTSGAGGSVTLADVVPGTLVKMGLSAGTTTGLDAPTRGIITKSPDGLGGRVYLKTSDGKDLVTDASALRLLSEDLLTLRGIERPGGVPLHARLTWDSGNFTFTYFASMPKRAEIETFNSNFALLDATDTFNITVNDPTFGAGYVEGPFAVTFPAGPGLTRDQVVTRVNALWATEVTGSSDGSAHVTSYLSGPYTWQSGFEVIEVSVDGGAFQTVTFLSTDVSSALVAARFSGDVTGATATTSGDFVEFRSDNTDGTTSSLEFRVPAGQFSDVFNVLGIAAGKYLGHFIAQPSGPSEIKLFGVGRGSTASIVIASANATSLARFGVTASTTFGVEEGEEPVLFPTQSPLNASASNEIEALISEVMDFGEVPVFEETDTSSFLNKAPGTPFIQSYKDLYLEGVQFDGLGIKDAGKASIIGPDGSLPPSVFSRARIEYENMFKQFIRGDFKARTVDALVAEIIETPGTAGNPKSITNLFTIDVDPSDATSAREFRIQVGRDGANVVPFRLIDTSALTIGLDFLVSANDDNGFISSFANETGPLRLFDVNTEAAGVTAAGSRYITLSSSVAAEGDQHVRLLDAVVAGDLVGKSILHRLNAVVEITVGDGVNSFGDFNGVDAIAAAVAFAASKSVSSYVIKLKRGTHSITANIALPINTQLRLEGIGQSTLLDCDVGFISGTGISLDIRNMHIRKNAPPFALIDINVGQLFMKNVFMFNVAIRLNDVYSYDLQETDIFCNNASADQPIIRVSMGDGGVKGSYLARNCVLQSGENNPVIQFRASAATLTTTGPVLFDNCQINLMSTTTDGNGNLVGNCGLVDMNPNGFDSLGKALGIVVSSLEFRNCNVFANTASGANSILLHLIPIANGAATSASPYIIEVTPAIKLKKFIISGGRWFVPSIATAVNPVTIGLAWTRSIITTPNDDSGIVEIKDVVFEIDQTALAGVNQGAPTQDCGSFFTQVTGGVSPAANIWGAFAFAGNFLTMRNVTILGGGQLSNSGELFLKCDRILNVDGIEITGYKPSGASSTPESRVRVRLGNSISSTFSPHHKIRNIVMRGTDALAGSWASGSIIDFEPSSNPTRIDNVDISQFTVMGAPGAAVGVQMRSADGYFGAPTEFDNFHMSKLSITKVGTGFQFIDTGLTIKNWSLCDSEIWESGSPIFILCAGRIGSLMFCGNHIHNNANGVYIGVSNWTGGVSTPSRVCMNNNIVTGNDSVNFIQIYLETLTGDQVPRGVIQGNVLVASTTGVLKVNRTVAGVATALVTPAAFSTESLRGIETGVAAFGPPTTYTYGNSAVLVNNQGTLRTP